ERERVGRDCGRVGTTHPEARRAGRAATSSDVVTSLSGGCLRRIGVRKEVVTKHDHTATCLLREVVSNRDRVGGARLQTVQPEPEGNAVAFVIGGVARIDATVLPYARIRHVVVIGIVLLLIKRAGMGIV